MANPKLTITSANSILSIAVNGLFDTPVILQGFGATAGIATATVNTKEIVMGLDGTMSAGMIFVEHKQTITLMPDSPSGFLFDAWNRAEQQARELFFADGFVVLPGLKLQYAMINGVLSGYTAIADVARVLQARSFEITWQNIFQSPL